MKNAHRGIAFVLFAVVIAAALSCSKKTGETAWKAEVETVNGVKTIRNPATPRYGELAFNLVEDLVIGEEKDENRFFPSGAGINVDGEGWIYVQDFGNKRIQVFDHEGKLLRSLGRIGQGPGEFQFPGQVMFDDEERPYVWAGIQIVAFNRDGSFRENRLLKAALNTLIMGPGGFVVGKVQPNFREEGGPKNRLVQFGLDGEPRCVLAVYPAYGASKNSLFVHWYSGGINFCRRMKDSLYYGFSLDETIHVVDAEGRSLFAFSKAEEVLPISDEEAALTRKNGISGQSGSGDREKTDLGMPDHRPFYSRFLSDDEGRLYIVRFKPITEKDEPDSKVDVFSKDGFYLYRMTWPFIPRAIRGGYFYKIQEDEESGLYKVIRYKIANWGDFKAD